MRVPRRVAFLSVFLCVVPCLRAQNRPGSIDTTPRTFYIRGQLRSAESGRAIEMVKVDLVRFTGELVGTTISRTNGEFEFSLVPSGTYQIVVGDRTYQPVRQDVEVRSTSRSGVLVFLRRAPNEPGPSPREATVSARELSIPEKARSAMEKGRTLLYEKNDPRKSLAQFEKAVAIYPGYHEAWLQIGVAHVSLNELQAAEDAYRRAVELSGGRSAPPVFALASILTETGHFADAEAAARRGLALEPNAWQGFFELGRAQAGLNKLQEAEESYAEVQARQPAFAPLYLHRANLHIRMRNQTALLQDLDTYLRLDPNGPISAQAREMRSRLQEQMAKQVPPPTPEKP